MPTNKPRLSIVLTNEEMRQVDHYRYTHSIASMSKAATELILKGLNRLDDLKPAHSPFTNEELSLIHAYRNADTDSKNEIRSVTLQSNRRAKSRKRPLTAIPEDNTSSIDADQFQILFDYFRSLDNNERTKFILSLIGKQPDVTSDEMLNANPNLTEKSV